MKWLYLGLFHFFSFGIRNHCFAGEIVKDSLEKQIEALLKKYTGKDRPEITVGIIDHRKLVFQNGYGMADLEKKTPN